MVYHNIEPVYDKNSRVLILGSFPSVKSRETGFYYGHPRNRFWDVLSVLFDEECPESIEEKKEFLLRNHIALWDVIGSCEIKGSSDVSIKNAVPNDVSAIMKTSRICSIFVNGKTAKKYYDRYLKSELDMEACVLPSTSPANAAWDLQKLIGAWQAVKNSLSD